MGYYASYARARLRTDSYSELLTQHFNILGWIPVFAFLVHAEHEVCGFNHPVGHRELLQCAKKCYEHATVASLGQSHHSLFAHVYVQVVQTLSESPANLSRIGTT